MDSITINISEKTARELEKASPKVRLRVEKVLEEKIERLIKRISFEKLDLLMDQMSDEAQANGLTEEILQEILNEDE